MQLLEQHLQPAAVALAAGLGVLPHLDSFGMACQLACPASTSVTDFSLVIALTLSKTTPLRAGECGF